MKHAIALLLALTLALCLSSCADNEEAQSSHEPHDAQSAAVIQSVPDESEDTPPSSDDHSSDSGEHDEDITETPSVYGCTRIENGIFVLLGNCEEGAEVTVSYNGEDYTSKSDHGYFSVRVDKLITSAKVTVVAHADGKRPSEPLEYMARPRKVSSSQWELIAGDDYQFHIKYTLDDYLRNNTYSDSTLSSLEAKLRRRVEDLRELSPETEIIYMLIPSPATVYAEGMPECYVPKNTPSRLDQLTDTITAAGIKVIDLRQLFADHKNDDLKLYWKTDSHWTDYGAYLAYRELFDYISKKHPQCAPRAFDEFDWQEDFYLGGDIAHYLEYFGSNGYNEQNTPMREYNALRVPRFELPTSIASVKRYVGTKRLTYNTQTVQNAMTVSTNRSELPSAIVMRDSYSTQLFDILAERFDTTRYKSMWDFTYSTSEIKQTQPDYVIYIIVERNLDNVFK